VDSSRGDHSASNHHRPLNHRLVIVGVGPGGLDRLPDSTRDLLLDPAFSLIVRTVRHPALAELAGLREVISGDDLYESIESFEAVYDQLAGRVLARAESGPVIFAVPGSPSVGEFAVARLRRLAFERGTPVELIGAESFVDVICSELSIDPLERGLQILDGRDLPDPFPLHVPTIIGQIDLPVVAAHVLAVLSELLGTDTLITVATDLGGPGARLETKPIGEFDSSIASLRTSLVLQPRPAGWLGAIDIMRKLRRDCPWDAGQTHQSLVANLTEEAAELAEALAGLPLAAPGGEPDYGAYADVEEELGDVLLQVLFHISMGEEAGTLRPDGVGQVLIDKLVRRHPHVFGNEQADSPDEVLGVWERAKASEKGGRTLFEGVANHLDPLNKAEKIQDRARGVGFDWAAAEPVYEKLLEEIAELENARTHDERLHELGDVLFTVINLARHLGVGSEVALRRAVHRFQSRLEWMESQIDLAAASPEDLENWWEAAKDEEE